MMRPWRDEEQATFAAGIKLAAIGLLVRRESVLNQDNDGVTSLESPSHHLLLSWTDAWRHEYHSLTSLFKKTMTFGLNLLL
jgi:hypothetical protein